MTQKSKPNFESREFAQQSVEQARKAVEDFIAAGRKVAAVWEGQQVDAQASAKNVAHKAMEFAEQNVAKWFEFTEKLVRAKDAKEVLQIQVDFVKAQAAAMRDRAQDLGQRVDRPPPSGPG